MATLHSHQSHEPWGHHPLITRCFLQTDGGFFLLSKSTASSGDVASRLFPLLIGVLLADVADYEFTPVLTLDAYIYSERCGALILLSSILGKFFDRVCLQLLFTVIHQLSHLQARVMKYMTFVSGS